MNDSNVQHMFTMDRERFLEYRERLRAVSPSAEHFRATLASRRADGWRGTQLLIWAAILGVLAGFWFVLSLSDKLSMLSESVFTLLFAVCGGAGAAMFVKGWVRWRGARMIVREAIEARNTLEDADGFLWRFESFLQDWDHNLPREVRDTLAGVCEDSKNGAALTARDDLLAYWYWASSCEGRMKVTKAELDW